MTSDLQESEERGVELFAMADVAAVGGAGQNNQLTVGDRRMSAGARPLERHHSVAVAVNDECRYGDLREVVAEILCSE